MRTDKFTQMLEAMYASYLSAAKKYGFHPISKSAFMVRMRSWEW